MITIMRVIHDHDPGRSTAFRQRVQFEARKALVDRCDIDWTPLKRIAVLRPLSRVLFSSPGFFRGERPRRRQAA